MDELVRAQKRTAARLATLEKDRGEMAVEITRLKNEAAARDETIAGLTVDIGNVQEQLPAEVAQLNDAIGTINTALENLDGVPSEIQDLNDTVASLTTRVEALEAP